ncbi:hypothetical protein [Parapedobacter sp. 10938]|uniref:hypothetical protein n=1 Tax=Parapedobacter flavus TaxID=3110225 RepID=UPI002DB662F2|nr:hypothetical protein [Parapedobacter sp. 10938]MEC3881179.1 hypothetical protein [Parapedobacter sp. 10938]
MKQGSRSIDLGDITMAKRSILIEEVDIGKPPIMMHKDTLVINPEAFSVQPNAVVEDLLKKVPGIVVWGDGEITVNGKKVERVLVNGKPFFGSDVVTSTRNLPSGAVDNIKVYEQPQQRLDEEAILEMDIRLKKPNGLFGKIQGSVGNQNRSEAILLMNYFDSKNQISMYGGKNNTNKRLRSLKEVLRSNVYKAGGEDINIYAPAFGKPGLNRFMVGGARFDREWSPLITSNVEMLYTSDETELDSDMLEFRNFEDQNDQMIAQVNNQKRRQDRWSIGGDASFKDRYRLFSVSSKLVQTKYNNEGQRDRTVRGDEDNVLSTWATGTQNSSTLTAGDFKIEYATKVKNGILKNQEKFSLSYRLNSSDKEDKIHQLSSFDNVEQGISEYVDRTMNKQLRRNQHDLIASVNLKPIISRGYTNWELKLNNTVKWDDIDTDQKDIFLDTATNNYTINKNLTFRDQFNELEWMPGLSLGRSYFKTIPRGTDIWGFTTKMDLSTTIRSNQSDNLMRNLDQQISLPIPSGSLFYQQRRQLWNSSWTLALKTSIRQPELEQLVAVMDETQKDYNLVGNPTLKPEEQYKFGFEYSRRSSVTSSSHRFQLNYTLVAHQMVDSSMYQVDGRRISYVVNAAGLPFYDIDYRYKSAPKLGPVPLNFSLAAYIRKGQNYYFNNGIRSINDNITSSLNGLVTGALYDHFLVSMRIASKKYLNTSNGHTTNSGNNSVGMDFTITWPRRTTFISSITTTNSYIKGISSDYLYFWNAHVYYRMLKKEQIEIKLSIYDILNNSKNISTFSNENIVRREQTNNLRQYIMLSLSYYPRFF